MYLNKVYNNPVLIQPTRELPGWVGVIGAGTIGPDIAYYLKSALPGLKLVLVDISQEALDRAVDRIEAYAQKGVDRGKLSSEQAGHVKQNILPATDYEALAYCDWVIEAATENLALKKSIFSKVEAIVRDNSLITSNTSSIPANLLFSHLEHPERCTVTHFFAPAFRNPAVEIIAWDKAGHFMIQYLRWLFYVTDKVPMVTKDVACFMLDRIFDNWCNEAALLLDKATPAQVDFVASDFVHAGPFYVLNLAHGNPIIIETNSLQAEMEGAHYKPAEIFTTTGKWDTIRPGEDVKVTHDLAMEIRDRLLGILFSQSVDILDRDIGTPEDLDLGCRLAFAFKKGPLELMRDLGKEETERILTKFSNTRPGMPTAGRPMQSYQEFQRFLLVDELDGVKIITLRRPEALNALHDEMTDEILNLIRQFEQDPETLGFVITGYGTRAFCAGADIGKFPTMLNKREQAAEYARACSRLLVYLDTCKKPVVAAVNGLALGGGLELAIRCHGIVATRNAWMQFPEITLGIVPGIGAMVVPYRKWPHASVTFHNMLLKAEKLMADDACETGMIDTLVDKHMNLVPAAVWLAKELADKEYAITGEPVKIAPVITEIKEPVSADGQRLSATVIDIMRQAIMQASRATSLNEALEIGYYAFGDSACTEAAREGISAFGERRKPDFKKTG